MQTMMLEAPMLETPTTMTTLATADNDVRSPTMHNTDCDNAD